MVKRKRLNVVSLIGSHTQVEEQRAASAQHQEQSQAQQSEQSEEVRGGGQQSHEEQSQPSLEINLALAFLFLNCLAGDVNYKCAIHLHRDMPLYNTQHIHE
ncbi:hypothetical protein V6N11_028414 [Hibiscus sabdariffa]|uniref:Uncharacterized protein n=1 Tax=Hibiscus sabdariffa TaxID=183260 RepID=A0ABR2NQG8_9ROSI